MTNFIQWKDQMPVNLDNILVFYGKLPRMEQSASIYFEPFDSNKQQASWDFDNRDDFEECKKWLSQFIKIGGKDD